MPTPDGEKLKRNGPNDVLRRHVHPTGGLAFTCWEHQPLEMRLWCRVEGASSQGPPVGRPKLTPPIWKWSR